MNSQELTDAVHNRVPQRLAQELGSGGATDWCEALIDVATKLGLSGQEVRQDIKTFLYQRILFAAIPSACGASNFVERKQCIQANLLALVGQHGISEISSTLVEMLAYVSAGLSDGGVGERDSATTFDAYAFAQLLESQGHRCAVCGVPLVENAAVADLHFVDGLERIARKTLEHILPFYLFGNNGSYEVLCEGCNTCKNDRLGVQEDGKVVAGNAVLAAKDVRVRRRLEFWTLHRARRCTVEGCTESSRTSVLYVDANRLPAVLGALRVVCRNHAGPTLRWLHHGHSTTLTDVADDD